MAADASELPETKEPDLAESGDPQFWQRMDALLAEALNLPEEERERWLSGLSGDDQPLADKLRAMLSRSGTTRSFLRSPVSPAVLAAAGEVAPLDEPGTMVGPYRLLRPLGAGGMGRVWLAERVDGALRRQVALKLPRTSWARGMAERLKQERDALAALEHPNIARLYDAGVTETGRPYLAMEYVDGVPIDRYVIEHGLAVRERLELFLQVAGAVSFAHAALIVHRDLKPSNVLVSGSQGVRLLDFGAAKLLRDEGPGDSEITRELGPALSPDYASPEQIRGERVTVATDVYSLGIVLYELLTGGRPYRLPRESWVAMVESVARVEIPLPSTRVPGDAKLARALRGDLDAVLGKALRREPAERYATVQAFADDVSRVLSDRPVLAKPPHALEQAWKFARRHALAVATAAAVTLLVGAAAGVALWEAREARAQAARAEQVRAFIASILTSATPRTGVGGVVTASDLLASAATRIETELTGQPAVAAELGDIIAQSFDSLGELSKAEPVLRAAVPRAEAAFGRSHPLTLRAKLTLADAVVLHDVPGALAIVEEVVPDALHGLPGTAEQAVKALYERAYVLAKLNRAGESYAALEQSIRMGEQYFGRLDQRTIESIGSLSNTYARFGERAKQLETAADAVERAREAFGAQRPHNTLILMERFYADALRFERPRDAVPVYRSVLADQRRLDAAETTRVRDALLSLGSTLNLAGQLEEGIPLVREAVKLERQQNPVDSDDRRGFGTALASALNFAQLTDEWLAKEEELEALVQRLGDEPLPSRLIRRFRSARLFAFLGRSARVRELAAEVHRIGAPTAHTSHIQAEMAVALDDRLQLQLSSALERLERAGREHEAEKLSTRIRADFAGELGMVRLELGDLAGAEAELGRCRELLQRGQVEPSIPVTPCLLGWARLQLLAGRPAEAEQQLVPLAASWEHVNPESSFRGEVLYWLARTERGLGKTHEAQRDAALAKTLLGRSTVPALRRLVEPIPR